MNRSRNFGFLQQKACDPKLNAYIAGIIELPEVLATQRGEHNIV
jgi:hypothetical protein